ATLVEMQGLSMSLDELPASIDATQHALRQAEGKRQQILASLEHRMRRIDAAMEAFSPTTKLRMEMMLNAEIEKLVDGYDWEQLQRVSETIPVFIREVLSNRLGAEFAAVAQQLVTMRNDILGACRQHMGEVSAELRLRFEGLRLPDTMTVSLDFDPKELEAR